MMSDLEYRNALDDLQATTITLFAEGRGEPIDFRIAVACVIRNRVAHPSRFAATYRGVCLQRQQFSCWIPAGGAENADLCTQLTRALVDRTTLPLTPLEAEIFRETWWVAEATIGSILRDRSNGSTHYYSPAAMKPKGTAPAWAKGLSPATTVNGSLFFRAA
jgi:conjugal transfer mating pair stabilization protein TraG